MRERLLGRPTHVESLEMRTLFCADAAVEDYAFAGPVPFHRDSGEVHMAAMHGGGGATTDAGGGGPIVSSSRRIVPLFVTDVVREGNQLVVQGMMGDQPFSAPIAISATPVEGIDCPILNLELGPIHLDLLGLIVDTSRICLDIEADPDGGILGSLLCGIANLLNGGTPLGTILDNLGGAVDTVLGALRNVFDSVFDQLTAANALFGVSGTAGPSEGGFDRTCDILNLRIGPLHLDLLGLEIDLDNCNNGPVRLDITAEEGPGNLLGNLLCALAGLLDSPLTPVGRINALLNDIRRAIDDLV